MYSTNAQKLSSTLKSSFPNLNIEINLKPPRRNSFECIFIDHLGKENLIWSGLKKGPPRKLKFPQVDDVLDAVRKQMS